MSNGNRWYAVHTQPQKETRAELNLRQQGYATYLPRYKRTRSHARHKDIVERPLFPRYLFVAMDLARDRWRAIQSTFGVSNLVLVGDAPASLPDDVVDNIRRREGNDGFITLGLPPGVGPGSAVRLIDGIFTDYTGVVDRIADEFRVGILLKFLGRDVRVSVPAASIGAV